MEKLPSGTVSLLFSDIEGSTASLSRLGSHWAEALDLYRGVCRCCWSNWGGTELGTEGDSFFVVFESAAEAACAAVQAQVELRRQDWPGGGAIRTRIGIHTGAPTRHGDGYVGIDVHLAARIASAAHGGQILASHAAAVLLGGALGGTASLVPLGVYRLKDFPSPERLYELTPDGVDDTFPPPRTPGQWATLPVFIAPLVGRRRELEALDALIDRSRVVVITGPGGVGKTRVAVAAAAERLLQRADAVQFVDATESATEGDLWAAIAAAFGIAESSETAAAVIGEILGRRLLLILDNLEQVDGSDRVVSALVSAAPDLSVLATSRRTLYVPGERDVVLAPMSAESETADVRDCDAVELFCHYASMANSAFEATADNVGDIVTICRNLDGLPLALELVASRVRMLTPSMLAARLQTSLDVSAGTVRTARHRTLRQAIAWSYDLLDGDHRCALTALSVFAGRVDVDACAAVIAPAILDRLDVLEVISDLHDLSLVTVTPDNHGEPAVGMLHAVRRFAAEQLMRDGDDDRARSAHAEHYASVADRLAGERLGRPDPRLAQHADNIESALEWQLDHARALSREQLAHASSLLRALCKVRQSGHAASQILLWAERIAHDASVVGADSDRLVALVLVAQSAGHLGDISHAQSRITAALAMTGDAEVLDRINLLEVASWIALMSGDVGEARELANNGLHMAESAGNDAAVAICVSRLAHVEAVAGNLTEEIKHHERLLDLYMALGESASLKSVRHNLAWAAHVAGDTEAAIAEMGAIADEVAITTDIRWKITFAEDYGAMLAAAGHSEEAAMLLGAADALRDAVSIPRDPLQTEAISADYSLARDAADPDNWRRHHQQGSALRFSDVIRQALALSEA